ncbi:hypothetical protein [Pigmentibacter ruber]|uniref:hypothetical protein n=1 Tax=Pigmentibacter ruber TaxID=2683196 RepID=UPI00131B7C2D|nr:hypothetical protein [Pigmentibacter ruber]
MKKIVLAKIISALFLLISNTAYSNRNLIYHKNMEPNINLVSKNSENGKNGKNGENGENGGNGGNGG